MRYKSLKSVRPAADARNRQTGPRESAVTLDAWVIIGLISAALAVAFRDERPEPIRVRLRRLRQH